MLDSPAVAPRVSICLPTYNRVSMLKRTLPTILDQRDVPFQLLICDDGSTDATQSWLESIHDHRVIVMPSHRRFGWPGVINHLIENAATEFVAIFHDHDLYQPGLLQKAVSLLDAYPSAVFSFTSCTWIDDHENTIATCIPYSQELVPGRQLLRKLILTTACPICASSVVIRRAALQQAGLFDSSSGLCGDVDLYIRLALIGDAVFTKEPVVRIRVWNETERPFKANWEQMMSNRKIRLDGCKRVFPAGNLRRPVWMLQVKLKYLDKVIRQGLWYWTRGDRVNLLAAGDQLQLSKFHFLRAYFLGLAVSIRMGKHLGILRHVMRRRLHRESV